MSMKVKIVSFKILPDGTKVIKEEKEIEVKRKDSKRQNKRPAKVDATLPEVDED